MQERANTHLRDQIVAEIRRLAAVWGRSPGKQAFEKATGITQGQWSGKLWASWADALTEAGLPPNRIQHRLAPDLVLDAVIAACRHYGHFPSSAELRLHRHQNPGPPSFGAIQNHFRTREDLIAALRQRCDESSGCSDIRDLLPPATPSSADARDNATAGRSDGSVYLLRSGNHYKIGRSDQIERRFKEIRVALPEATKLVHTIKTDDPAGIEAYWHKRFQDRRLNGEWFDLSAADIAAFRKRRFQ
jgi:hypothetical protein